MMSQYLYGIHDWSSSWGQMVRDAGKTAWCVTTHALSEKASYDFRPLADYNVTPIARLNHGYGSTGTIPTPDNYADFADTCAEFVARSPGCTRWIIGNEPNHTNERPNGLSITPEMYADCFLRCRDAIRREAGTQQQVMPAAIAPWNVSSGDWLRYFVEVMRLTSGGDGICLHTYTHGAYAGLITSEARMDPPYEERRYEFRAYLDFLHALPNNVPDLPVYITETDQTQEWIDKDNGWIPAAYHEIARYNRVNQTRHIHALVLYRWPNYDIWGFESKAGVHAGFRAALAQDYRIPQVDGNPSPQPAAGGNHTTHMPIMHGNGPTEPQPAPEQSIEWDSRLTELGVRINPADTRPGDTYWRVMEGRWLDTGQSGGRHHIFVDVIDEDGERVPGVQLLVQWPSGSHVITTEEKTGEPYAANFPMSTGRNAFRIQVADDIPSDEVTGIGMGAPTEDGGFNAGLHTSTTLVFLRTVASEPQTGNTPPTAVDPAPQPQAQTGDKWQRSLDFVRRWEGGWADNPVDPGGATMRGITFGTYTRWREAQGQPKPTKADLRNISDAEVERIYYEWYWLPSGADALPWPDCLGVFDLAVNGGVGRSDALTGEVGSALIPLTARRLEWYTNIDGFEHFGRAWVRRCADLLRVATE